MNCEAPLHGWMRRGGDRGKEVAAMVGGGRERGKLGVLKTLTRWIGIELENQTTTTTTRRRR